MGSRRAEAPPPPSPSIKSLAHPCMGRLTRAIAQECIIYVPVFWILRYTSRFMLYNRGGASEVSVATLTGDADGSSRYMYDTCVKP